VEQALTKQQRFRAAHPNYDRDWQRRQPIEKRRDRWLRARYGISWAEYQEILKAQGGKCAVDTCTEPPGGRGGTYHVDHDHITGKVRGLLCSNCNRALGLLRDLAERVEGLARYIRSRS
jgi:Recombination endonuclease VII